jgi:hypothetical protein
MSLLALGVSRRRRILLQAREILNLKLILIRMNHRGRPGRNQNGDGRLSSIKTLMRKESIE